MNEEAQSFVQYHSVIVEKDTRYKVRNCKVIRNKICTLREIIVLEFMVEIYWNKLLIWGILGRYDASFVNTVYYGYEVRTLNIMYHCYIKHPPTHLPIQRQWCNLGCVIYVSVCHPPTHLPPIVASLFESIHFLLLYAALLLGCRSPLMCEWSCDE